MIRSSFDLFLKPPGGLTAPGGFFSKRMLLVEVFQVGFRQKIGTAERG